MRSSSTDQVVGLHAHVFWCSSIARWARMMSQAAVQQTAFLMLRWSSAAEEGRVCCCGSCWLCECICDLVQYRDERDLATVMNLVDNELSEPYSIFTYRYFLTNWPWLCFLVRDGSQCFGTVVCRLDTYKNRQRGYLAMLVVEKEFRTKGVGEWLWAFSGLLMAIILLVCWSSTVRRQWTGWKVVNVLWIQF